jgi:hypothetical protein
MAILIGGRDGKSQFTMFLNINYKWQAEIVLVGKSMCGFRPPKYRHDLEENEAEFDVGRKYRRMRADHNFWQIFRCKQLKKVVFVRLQMYRHVTKKII